MIFIKYSKEELLKNYNKCLNEISKTLKADVSWRFTFIDVKNHEVYLIQ